MVSVTQHNLSPFPRRELCDLNDLFNTFLLRTLFFPLIKEIISRFASSRWHNKLYLLSVIILITEILFQIWYFLNTLWLLFQRNPIKVYLFIWLDLLLFNIAQAKGLIPLISYLFLVILFYQWIKHFYLRIQKLGVHPCVCPSQHLIAMTFL